MLHKPEQRVLRPETISELLGFLKQRPDCILSAGNTFLATNPFARLELHDRDIISLDRLEELKRTVRTDRFTEFGAMVTLEKIINLDSNLVPPGFRQGISKTVPFPARTLATLGGNLSLPAEMLNLLPLLASWDTRLELRRQGATRYLPAKDFINTMGELNLEPGEVLVRIRMPLQRWNHQIYERIEGEDNMGIPSMAFAGLARVSRNTIEEIRLTWCFSNHRYHMHPSIDAQLFGQKIPIPDRDIQTYLDESMAALIGHNHPDTPQVLPRLQGLARRFLRTLPVESPF